ncbi:DNA polymerase III, delta subunit [Propionibacterium ruminifibrarum]|uniref:DNA-directed DNA polymerase n=1 Tax=Propionibacterium ruminifibrarum TaxID=1962131 RepID=A0A375I2K6_9ACTN|nr:DNA polymerase III, delta subunit [Propionibacterium ruminifibrarum]
MRRWEEKAGARWHDGGVSPESVFGTTTLVHGSESLLAERAIARILDQARAEQPDAQINELDASSASAADFLEATGESLFATCSVVVLRDVGSADEGLAARLLEFAEAPTRTVSVIAVHGGGTKGRGLLTKLRKAKVTQIAAEPLKAWELTDFVINEARDQGMSIEGRAAQGLVEAVGKDLRALAGAVSQLSSDWQGERLTAEVVNRYFAGRVDITGYAVSADALAGQPGQALEKLRWALSCGVHPAAITAAFAADLRALGLYLGAQGERLRDNEMARICGVGPWKVKTLRAQARGWQPGGVARALVSVATADAAVKGAATDPHFVLEQMLLAIDGARSAGRGVRRR